MWGQVTALSSLLLALPSGLFPASYTPRSLLWEQALMREEPAPRRAPRRLQISVSCSLLRPELLLSLLLK